MKHVEEEKSKAIASAAAQIDRSIASPHDISEFLCTCFEEDQKLSVDIRVHNYWHASVTVACVIIFIIFTKLDIELVACKVRYRALKLGEDTCHHLQDSRDFIEFA